MMTWWRRCKPPGPLRVVASAAPPSKVAAISLALH
jgi:hypothetical protein